MLIMQAMITSRAHLPLSPAKGAHDRPHGVQALERDAGARAAGLLAATERYHVWNFFREDQDGPTRRQGHGQVAHYPAGRGAACQNWATVATHRLGRRHAGDAVANGATGAASFARPANRDGAAGRHATHTLPAAAGTFVLDPRHVCDPSATGLLLFRLSGRQWLAFFALVLGGSLDAGAEARKPGQNAAKHRNFAKDAAWNVTCTRWWLVSAKSHCQNERRRTAANRAALVKHPGMVDLGDFHAAAFFQRIDAVGELEDERCCQQSTW